MRQDDEDRRKAIERDLKIKEKIESSKYNIQCYNGKRYEYMMCECPSKDNDLNPKWMKVLQATLESDDVGSEDCLSEFYYMTIKEEREEDFESAFEEL